ncbi:hypothetical protein DACRYDRAFT_109982 [Dacryopinax primogenitus]|uniref:Peptidase S28 n=1 Tax=Dacryopinax primogenitus (strain DJM 731) TaxID=1858805 RepID=M5G0B0_DACPD|nr:uncharacterized protein DACRYDRAFT_109982 [Dacryopinax primogenitus]EJT99261.1 hypothetical protein DACRYDRAFT_109982 [Dacryopinax primogenitus]
MPDLDAETEVYGMDGTKLKPLDTVYTFDQLIDHSNPSLGTFKQRYYFTYQYYLPGGPVVMMTPGENSVDGFYSYLTNGSMVGQIAQQQNGAAIILEHRFYGKSNPYPDLSVKSYQVHSIDQAVNDLVYFSQNVKLAMPGGNQIRSQRNAWILLGGSYSGALTAWTVNSNPDAFWAGYASSAVVQAINDGWMYFEPIRTHMPWNCSADWQALIGHFDKIAFNGTKEEQQSLKTQLGFPNVTYLDDVASALRDPIFMWQDMDPSSGPGEPFYKFCDALETDGNGKVSGPQGFGLNSTIKNFAAWVSTWNAESCGEDDQDACYGSRDPTNPAYSNTTIDQDSRSWQWTTCNFAGWWEVSAPNHYPSLVSRLITPKYDERDLCQNFFPEAYPTLHSANVSYVNNAYGGWHMNADRLIFLNGNRDPWKFATVSSDYINRTSTPNQPITVSDGFHCSDLLTANGEADNTIYKAQQLVLQYMEKWMDDWYTAHPSYPNPTGSALKKKVFG